MILENIRLHLKVTPRTALAAAFVPIVSLALFFVMAGLSGMNRYDNIYFTREYLERYHTPGATAEALLEALRANDAERLAELQGLRHPARFVTSPDMALTILYEKTDTYTSYLYYDTRTYHRYPHHFEKVKGRWVVALEDFYYLLRSGKWLRLFVPIS